MSSSTDWVMHFTYNRNTKMLEWNRPSKRLKQQGTISACRGKNTTSIMSHLSKEKTD